MRHPSLSDPVSFYLTRLLLCLIPLIIAHYQTPLTATVKLIDRCSRLAVTVPVRIDRTDLRSSMKLSP